VFWFSFSESTPDQSRPDHSQITPVKAFHGQSQVLIQAFAEDSQSINPQLVRFINRLEEGLGYPHRSHLIQSPVGFLTTPMANEQLIQEQGGKIVMVAKIHLDQGSLETTFFVRSTLSDSGDLFFS
tara:strand:- start:232 stop:609 length:378 start_codon:yes stop_codon:yes gene_type:complete